LAGIDARTTDTTFASGGCPQRQTETNDHPFYLHSFLLVEFDGRDRQSKLKVQLGRPCPQQRGSQSPDGEPAGANGWTENRRNGQFDRGGRWLEFRRPKFDWAFGGSSSLDVFKPSRDDEVVF
jgi:hypothetical protein